LSNLITSLLQLINPFESISEATGERGCGIEPMVDMMEELELGLKPVKAYEIDEAFFQQFSG
jgi:hypothetical protein